MKKASLFHKEKPLANQAKTDGDVILSIQNVSKTFYHLKSARDLLKFMIRGDRANLPKTKALHDISFEMKRGQTLGIVGRNGSGKSTLLHIITGTMTPTHGKVVTHGRIAALLELGAGFNPELTGRENIKMSASIIGMDKQQIDEALPQILKFADIGDFIDRPLRTYSSGMMVRLGFATAIHTAPDILIIDEALAVGDEAFQRKCFAFLENFKAAGGTILFVSHSASHIIGLCDEAVLLDKGKFITRDHPKAVMNLYHQMLYDRDEAGAKSQKKSAATTQKIKDDFDPSLISESKISYQENGARILELAVRNLKNQPVNLLKTGASYEIICQVEFSKNHNRVVFGAVVRTIDGRSISAITTRGTDLILESVKKNQIYEIRHRFDCHLLQGTYLINCGVSSLSGEDQNFLHRWVDGAIFKVLPTTKNHRSGLVDLGLTTTIKKKN